MAWHGRGKWREYDSVQQWSVVDGEAMVDAMVDLDVLVGV